MSSGPWRTNAYTRMVPLLERHTLDDADINQLLDFIPRLVEEPLRFGGRSGQGGRVLSSNRTIRHLSGPRLGGLLSHRRPSANRGRRLLFDGANSPIVAPQVWRGGPTSAPTRRMAEGLVGEVVGIGVEPSDASLIASCAGCLGGLGLDQLPQSRPHRAADQPRAAAGAEGLPPVPAGSRPLLGDPLDHPAAHESAKAQEIAPCRPNRYYYVPLRLGHRATDASDPSDSCQQRSTRRSTPHD